MREILFRGKRLQGGNWVEGYFFKSDINKRERESKKATLIFTPDCDTFIMVPECHNSFMVVSDTVGQYTGLTDKNGKRIFEGDIVNLWCEPRTDNQADEFKKYKAVIEFGNPNFLYSWGWQLKMIDNMPFNNDTLLWVDMEEAGAYIEVIGNIHDNKLEDFDNGR